MSAIRLFLLFASIALGGCASPSHNPKDPFESFNRGMYRFNDTLDKAVVKPAAKGYNAVVPAPGKMMISNFFSNLNDITVAINDLLQFKVVQAVSDGGRILVNTTVGLFGLVDVASVVGLEKHNEDFGQTLGYWGFGNGPYLVIPFFGPSSIRDGVGLYADTRSDVLLSVDHVDTRNQLYATKLLDKRASLLDQEKVLDEAMIDQYSFIRDAYMQHRRSLIYDGNPPREKFDDDEEEDSKPGKRSSNGREGSVPAAEAAYVAAPVATETLPMLLPGEPSASEQAPVLRVWVSQGELTR